MKKSRAIRRHILRIVPEWMKCFARSVIKAVKARSRQAVAGIRTVCWKSRKLLKSISAQMKNSRAQIKTAVCVLAAAGLALSPYAMDFDSSIQNSQFKIQNCYAAPAGGQVVGGNGTITTNGTVTTINQATDRLAIDWQNFDIAKGETVNFSQPGLNSVALNRIIAGGATSISGSLNANGQIYIVNPNGLNINSSALVNVGGLVLSTANADASLFMKSGYVLPSGRNANIVIDGSVSSNSAVLVTGAKAVNISGKVTTPGGAFSVNDVNNAKISGIVDVSASGTTGTGGLISIIADNTSGSVDLTNATLFAKGGTALGIGGLVTTKAASVSGLNSATVSTVAADGSFGTTGKWQIETNGFTIGSDISGAALNNALSNNSVAITTDVSSTNKGDLTVNDAINWAANTNLTLSAANNVVVNQNISNVTGTAINITLRADNTGIGYTSASPTSGGNVNFASGTVVSVSKTYTSSGATSLTGTLESVK